MKSIPNIKLNNKDLYNLLTYNMISSGSEGFICESSNPYTLYKLFCHYNKKAPMCDNKVKKIMKLYQMNLEHCVNPVSTISYGDMIIGYEMTTDVKLESYRLYQLNNEELIYYLYKTKEILEYFYSKDIIYGDMAPRNILFNKNNLDVKFCDMDNIKLGDYEMDEVPANLLEYEEKRGIDDCVHPYLHNIMTMDAYQIHLHLVNNRNIWKNFYLPARKIIHSMEDVETFKGEYLIKYKKKNK